MRKLLKRVLSCIIAGSMIFSVATNASASSQTAVNEDGLYLVSETETVLEDGTIETSRVYSSVNPRLRAVSGSGTFRNEKELTFSNADAEPFKYWVQGYFTWNSVTNTVTISNPVFGHDPVRGTCKIENEVKRYDSNQGFNFLFGRKYAYISYIFSYVNWVGLDRTCDVYLDVNVDGVSSHN